MVAIFLGAKGVSASEFTPSADAFEMYNTCSEYTWSSDGGQVMGRILEEGLSQTKTCAPRKDMRVYFPA